MHEQLLLLKKIAEYFNKIQKTEIANIINEELQKEVEKNPDFSEPEYVKDDLPTIFFRHVTLKRRKSEASIRKSMGNTTNNTSKARQKTKKSVVNFAPESTSSSVIDENQENVEINNNAIEILEESNHSILAPINTNRMSENIVRKSQFLPDIRSTPNHSYARTEHINNEIKLENVDVNELNFNEINNYDDDDDNNSLINYDPEENFHQTIYNSDYQDNSNVYDINNFENDYEAFIRESQLDIKTEDMPNENNNYVEDNDFVLKQSVASRDNLEEQHNNNQSIISDDNNVEAMNQLNINVSNEGGNNLEEQSQSEISPSFDWTNNTKAEIKTQTNQNGENLFENEENLQQIKINQSDNSQTFPQENNLNSETVIESFPFQCGQIQRETDKNSDSYSTEQDREHLEPTQSQDLFGTSDTENCEELKKVTNEIAIQCDPEELLCQLLPWELRINNSKTRKRSSGSNETDNRKKRRIDHVDLDVEEIDTGNVESTTNAPPTRVRTCSLSSIESLPVGDTGDPQPVKLKRNVKPAIVFKEDKKLDIKRRILLSDGWILWPSSLLSGCLKHYNEESFLEVIDSELDREQSWTRKQLLNIYLENIFQENIIHKLYHSGKKHDFFVKLSILPEDLMDSLDINPQVYNDILWYKNLGPKNGRKLCAEGAPQIYKDLLNIELEFVNTFT